MSLINQVLRDLDARGAAGRAERYNPWSPDAPRAEEAHFHAHPTGGPGLGSAVRSTGRRRSEGTAWRRSLLVLLAVLLLGMMLASPWAPHLTSQAPVLEAAGAGLARVAALPSVLSTTLRPAEAVALGEAARSPVAVTRRTTPSSATLARVTPHSPRPAQPEPPVPPAAPAAPATVAALAVEDVPPPAAGVPRKALAAAASPTAVAGTSAAAAPAALATATALPGEAGTVEKKMTPLSPAQRAQAAYAQAVESTQAGRPVQAQAQAMEALRLQPGHQAARHLAAALLHETGRTDAGIELLREGLAQDPRADGLALLLARLQAHKGLLQEAVATLDRHQLHAIEAEALRAGLCSQLRQYKPAIQAYQAVLERQPGQVNWWLGLAVALEGDGQTALARQTFSRVQAMGLSDPELVAYVTQRLKALE